MRPYYTAITVLCPKCGARPGESCKTTPGERYGPHLEHSAFATRMNLLPTKERP